MPSGSTLDDLVVFVAVAQQRSFVQASRRLAISTSGASRAVARLEESLAVPLLRRTSRSVAVTDEGQQLVQQAVVHLEGLGEALAVAAEQRVEPSGVVRVTAPAYTGSTRIATALAGFAAQYPEIAIELDATNAIRDLVDDSFDFGLRIGPYLHPDFVARKLTDGQFGLFAAKTFVKRALAGKSRIGKEKLEREPCIVLRTGAKWRFRSRDGASVELSPRARFAVNDPRAAVNVARLGVGITLVPVDAVSQGDRDLVQLQPDFGTPEPIGLFIVYPTRRLLPQRVRLAIEWLFESEGKATHDREAEPVD